MNLHKLVLRGRIGEPDSNGDVISLARVRMELAQARHADSLLVVLDSGGGKVHEADGICAAIMSHPVSHKVCVIVRASSAAVKVALACPKRWARHDASILLHSISRKPDGRWTAERHQETARRLRNSDAELAAFYARRTGMLSADWFLRQMRDEAMMPLYTALRCGLIHRVLDQGMQR